MILKDKEYSIGKSILITFKLAPITSILCVFVSVVSGILSPVLVLVVAGFIDNSIAYAKGAAEIQKVILDIELIGLIYILQKIGETLYFLTSKKIEDVITLNLEPEILKKCANLQYRYIECNDTWDLILRVKEGKGFGQGFPIVLSAVQLILQIVGLFLILAMQVWWLVFIVFIAILPIVLISLRSGKYIYEMNRKVSSLTRVMDYFSTILMNREAAPERNLFGFSDFVNQKFMNAHRIRTNANTRTIISRTIQNRSSGFFLIVYVIFVMIVMLDSLRRGDITSGMYISLVGSLATVFPSFANQVSNFFQELSRINENWKDFNEFINLEEDVNFFHEDVVEEPLVFEKLEFRNASFKYPGTDQYVLKNISFVLDKNGHYALVGANGAGKSTIIKLIVRLYDLEEGEILLNGINIKDYSYRPLSAMFGIVYQDFAKYSISIQQNIRFGDETYDIEVPMKSTGLDKLVSSLPNGVDTQLGKLDQEGIDISGGEWQKLAIARALYGKSTLKIFDEPTASLSPVSESEIYKKFDDLTKDSTSILITHRLGSTKIVDEILVFDNGNLVEQGPHEKLMLMKGTYFRMYESQRKWYDE